MQIIRDFERKDFEDVLEVVETFSLDHRKMATEELPLHWDIEGAHYFVCEVAGKVVGHLGYKPDLWGAKGIFWYGKLWDHLEEHTKANGGRKIYFDVGNAEEHGDAIRLYEKRGYILEGTLLDYWGDNDHFLVFAKKI